MFQSDIHSGRAFFSTTGVTFSFYNADDVNRIHEESEHIIDSEEERDQQKDKVACFAFSVNFEGSSSEKISGEDINNYHVNYFVGNDSSRWASDLPVYNRLNYSDLYPGIDLVYYSEGDDLKYDFIVAPRADPSIISMQYVGLNSILLRDNTLQLELGFMTITEVIPAAYQFVNGTRREVNCRFALEGNGVHFIFPEGYDHSCALVIDPTVMASTYSGGTSVTRGYCSTFDDEGNIYAAGSCYGTGFPVTLGAYDVLYSSGGDIVISKYSPDGSNLLYCTYIGGIGEEYPHSMIVQNGNLFIYGTTFSFDFPVSAQSYSQNLNGICDIYIACLSTSGSTLLASTFIGGTWSDGVNMIQVYRCDSRRGEIITAANGDVLVASGTLSQNFPTTPGAFRANSSGGQDGIVFRMNASLSTLIWSTYIGSGIHDMAFGIRESSDGAIFVCGAANNMFSPFPTVAGCYQPSPLGALDAFIAKFNSSGTTLLACTFYGGSGRDIGYFLDIDRDGDVYIFGESNQSVPITPDVFFVRGGRNFIAKLDPSLTTLLFSTVIGTGSVSNVNIGGPSSSPPSSDPHVGIRMPRGGIVPSAFRVDQCKRIYFCGFGSDPNWPLTDDALYQFSGDNQCYIGVLEENATELLCATMYGGWHTDGGMGRFDQNGILYQSTCQNDMVFPTTPWAFSNGSSAGAWDVCVFKIDMHSELEDAIQLPNVFTPNNDGINDKFIPGFVTTNYFEIVIYDRFGMKIFSSSDPFEGWDGTYNGNNCAEGVYYCTLQYIFCTELIEKTSFVHLQR